MMTFDQIIAPLGRADFLAKHWTREAVHIPGAGKTFDTVFGWSGLNAVLDAHDLAFPQVKMSRREEPVPVEKFTVEAGGRRLVDTPALLELFREGASFGITGADSHWPPLRGVIDALYDVLLESIHTNVYCSPANTQGFQCHFDLHEVFVLQVEGSKHWKVFRPTIDAPVASWRAEDAPVSEAPYVDVVLRKGDVLYVPRGHWHYAVAQDSTSLHITVGVTCRKGSFFGDWLAGQLVDRPAWRRNTPLMTAASSGMSPEFSAWVNDLKRSLAAALDDPHLDARFWKAIFDDIRPRQHVDLAVQAALDDWPIEQLAFDRPSGRRHVIESSAGGLVVSAGGCDIELEAADRRLIERVFEADSFTWDDVHRWQPGLDVADAADLLRALVRAGLLSVRAIAPTRQPSAAR